MSEEEVRRAGVLGGVAAGELSQVEAAERLGLSHRQVKRLYRRYRQQGARGLVHGNAGKPSHHGQGAQFRNRVLGLVRKHYGGKPGERFGQTLRAEENANTDSVSAAPPPRRVNFLPLLARGGS